MAERRVPALHLVGELLNWVSGALEEVGDLGPVRDLVAGLVRHGIGAAHQRRAAVAGLAGVVAMLGVRTISGTGTSADRQA
jgi:carboxylate-amine ligase